MKRRDFIKTMGMGAAGLVLGGCGIHSKVVTKVDANAPENHGVAVNLLKPAKYRYGRGDNPAARDFQFSYRAYRIYRIVCCI